MKYLFIILILITNMSLADEKIFLNELKKKIENSIPRTEFNFESVENSKPEYSILTVQPIHENLEKENLSFFQGSFYRHDGGERHTINLGYGLRKFLYEKNILTGVNIFYDNEFPHNHQQLGFGLELKSSAFEINSNYYNPLTKWKSGQNNNLERAMKGYSNEIGGQVPYIPSAKIYYKKFKRDAIENAIDYNGNVYSLNLNNPIFPGTILELGYNQINDQENSTFIKITFNSELFKKQKSEGLEKFIDDKIFNFSTIDHIKLAKVRRENKIIKEVKSNSNCSGLCFRVKGSL